jgi:hypothetical protein
MRCPTCRKECSVIESIPVGRDEFRVCPNCRDYVRRRVVDVFLSLEDEFILRWPNPTRVVIPYEQLPRKVYKSRS